MKARLLIAIISIVALVGLGANASQETLTEEEFDATMKEVGLTLGDAEGHIDSRYWPETVEDGRRLQSMFQQVEAFWKAQEVGEAAAIAADAVAAARAMTAAASGNNHDDAQRAFGDLRSTCATCHQSYREQMDDGYRIKPRG